MRTLAALAGVSPMTVSLALRNHASVSAATAAKVQKLAAAAGYRPDPEISKLMHRLRTVRSRRQQATLCALRLQWVIEDVHFGAAVLEGARRRADSLGFGFDVMDIDASGFTPRRLQSILRSKGVEGLLLLPMRELVRLAELLDWSRFAAVSATSSVISPVLHTATPDVFGNTLLLCQKLSERGCRRIGLVSIAEYDMRVNHRVVSPYLWHSHFGGGETLPPLILPHYDPEPALVQEWLSANRPDAIVTSSEFTLAQISRLAGNRQANRITFASTTLLAPATSRFCGMVDHGPEVGAAAVDILAGMIQRGERGVPSIAYTTLIGGQFFDPTPNRRTPRARAGKS